MKNTHTHMIYGLHFCRIICFRSDLIGLRWIDRTCPAIPTPNSHVCSYVQISVCPLAPTHLLTHTAHSPEHTARTSAQTEFTKKNNPTPTLHLQWPNTQISTNRRYTQKRGKGWKQAWVTSRSQISLHAGNFSRT